MNSFLALQNMTYFLRELSPVNYLILVIGALLWVSTPKLVARFYPSHFDLEQQNRQRVIRAIALYSLYFYVRSLFPEYDEHWLNLLVNVLAVIYLAYTSFNIINYYLLKHYGNVRDVAGQTRVSETYSSRMLGLLARIAVFIVALILIIRMLGYQSLLETGGAIGIIGVFLALTQSVWAPDIFNGLILLNSEMLDEDDVIEICNEDIIGVVYKIKMFHTEILNLKNNHRLMIRNAKLRDYIIHNYSCFSSAKGLREQLLFKVGYDNTDNNVRTMFNDAFEAAKNDSDLPIEFQHEAEISIEECGDHAVLWGLHYYIKDVKHVLVVRKKLRALVLQQSRIKQIALATPSLLQRTSNLEDGAHFPTLSQDKQTSENLQTSPLDNKLEDSGHAHPEH